MVDVGGFGLPRCLSRPAGLPGRAHPKRLNIDLAMLAPFTDPATHMLLVQYCTTDYWHPPGLSSRMLAWPAYESVASVVIPSRAAVRHHLIR